MRKRTTKTEHHGKRHSSLLCAVALAAFALFVACERPEPEPEPPTPPTADTDTLPTNKFVGTWVLCAMNDVNSEPPATCDLANATSDTLVFVDDTTLIIHRGTNIFEYSYEISDHYFVYNRLDASIYSVNADQFYFREDDQELVLRGIFNPIWGAAKYYSFRRISHN